MKQNDDLKSFTVTIDLLLESNACDKATLAFANAFPSGTASMRDVVEHPACEREWIGWMACNLNGLTPEIGLELIERSDDPAYLRGEAAAYAHWVTPEIGFDLIERSNDPAYLRGTAAAYAHWVTPEIGFDLIERSDSPSYWRGTAAAHAHWMAR